MDESQPEDQPTWVLRICVLKYGFDVLVECQTEKGALRRLLNLHSAGLWISLNIIFDCSPSEIPTPYSYNCL